MVNVLFGKFRFLCTLLRGKKKEIVYNCYQLQTRHLTEISAEQANMRLYIYIYLNGGVRVSDLYERGSQLIAPPTNVIEASLARMEISLGYIASSIDLLTHRTLRRVTPSYTYIHTHIVSRKMHAMREIFLRYLKIVRVLQGRSLGIRFTGFLFEVFRLKKKKSESSAQSMGIFSFIDREKRIWVR